MSGSLNCTGYACDLHSYLDACPGIACCKERAHPGTNPSENAPDAFPRWVRQIDGTVVDVGIHVPRLRVRRVRPGIPRIRRREAPLRRTVIAGIEVIEAGHFESGGSFIQVFSVSITTSRSFCRPKALQ